MILHCDFEELAALNAAVSRALERAGRDGAIAAPPLAIRDIEALQPRLNGDITVDTLADQAGLRRAVAFLAEELRARMESNILEQHPAAEAAVLAYFEFARVLCVLRRLDQLGREMAALVELMTGQPPAAESAQRFSFPDE